MKKPASNRSWGDRMKMHLRRFILHGKTYTVITLRPGLEVSWSTNYFHETWHILGNMRSAKVLSHLMWGLSYQKVDNTFVFIDSTYMRPNPFDANSSNPIIIGVRKPHKDLLARLKSSLGPPDQTIRWRTFGLTSLLEDDEARLRFIENNPVQHERKLKVFAHRVQGTLVIYGVRDLLRFESLWIHNLNTRPSKNYAATMDYHYLGNWHDTNGEVQIFHDYQSRLRCAKRARTDILGGPNPPTDPEEIKQAIQLRAYEIRQSDIDGST